MNIVFVNYHDFRSNSAVHIFNLADTLVALGHHCAVVVPDAPETANSVGTPTFPCLTYAEALAGQFTFPDGGGPSVIHAWTPREGVRGTVQSLAQQYQCPYVVHLEDNEELLTSSQTGASWQKLSGLSAVELATIIGRGLSHPLHYRAFLEGAAGVTALVDRLLEFKPAALPGMVFWPAFEADVFMPQAADPALRQSLRIPENNFVVVYSGNAHVANAAEMRSLYLAIAAVNRRDLAVTLVRTGTDYVDFLGADLADVRRHVIEAGRVEPRRETVPRYLALADVLIQPGRADAFNDYRFPSKLPEFFGMGKPVILPQSNIGHHIRDGIDGVLLQDGSALEIAEKLEALLRDPERRARLGRGARAFADANLSWRKSAAQLVPFYESAIAAHTPAPHPAPPPIATTRRDLLPPADGLSYATVEDYSDSKDNLAELASIAGDLKDVQRPWCVKAILSKVPRGGRLLEIGGGDPWVANFLTNLGYEVWLIDPYEGLGTGPTEFEVIRRQYPKVHFIRGWFPTDLKTDKKFDAIYSISVLEHAPAHLIESVASAMPNHISPGGWSIHAIDHVTHGSGAAWHRAELEIIARCFGFPKATLDQVLSRLDNDPDAYFLSPDGHNLWRGKTPYRELPMRRCVSIQFCYQPRGA